MGEHAFLEALTVVLCTAGFTTVICQRLRQPVVLGYILAGLIVGPHVPIPLVADRAVVEALSEAGVILLMFSLGLEFSLRKLVEVGPTAGVTAIIQSSIMLWLGYISGQMLGWTPRESLFTGAIIAISSTTIIAKAFEEQRVTGKLRELVVSVLIVEDLIAILLLALLTAVASGEEFSAATLARSSGRLAVFLLALLALGLLLVPRMIRAILRLDRSETTVVASIGICFAISLLARYFGYSVALGAFLAGSLVAESGEGGAIASRIGPVRDVFAAVFFVSVGMLIDPYLVAAHWPAVAILTVIVILGKIVGVSLGAFLAGNGVRTSIRSGMSLAQIGEFSFIIAGVGIASGAVDAFLYPVAVAVSALTTLTTPWLIRASGPVASFVDRKLPRRIQTFASLYGSWVERMRTGPRSDTVSARTRRLAGLLVIDAALLAAIVIGAALGGDSAASFLARHLDLTFALGRAVVLVLSLVAALPFVLGVFRLAGALGATLADIALPAAAQGSVDLSAAPRRALVVTLQISVVLLTLLPLFVITQPFLPELPLVVVAVLVIAILGPAFWRSATNLQGHVKAGAELIVAALAAQAQKGSAPAEPMSFSAIQALLPGLGEPMPVEIEATSPAVGKTLAQLDVRGSTGATVLAIRRGEHGMLVPSARELLQAGDILALAGTHEAVAAARELLVGPISEASSLTRDA